jgi:hypothetical protein
MNAPPPISHQLKEVRCRKIFRVWISHNQLLIRKAPVHHFRAELRCLRTNAHIRVPRAVR